MTARKIPPLAHLASQVTPRELALDALLRAAATGRPVVPLPAEVVRRAKRKRRRRWHIGDQVGFYTLLGTVPRVGKWQTRWIVQCRCGRVYAVPASSLYRRAPKCKACNDVAQLKGRTPDVCRWCGKRRRSGRRWNSRTECPSCNRRAARNGRYANGSPRWAVQALRSLEKAWPWKLPAATLQRIYGAESVAASRN